MKKLFLLFALLGVLAVGCEELLPNEQKPGDNPTEQPEGNHIFITDSESSYTVEADGGEVMVIVATNLEYSIAIPEEAQSWLSVADTRAEERIDKCTFIVARNDSFDERSATAELIDTEGKVLQTITFVQNGQPKVFETDSEGNYRVVANGGEVEVAVTTNLEYSVVISEDAEEWLSVADTRVVIREDKLTFVVAVNESFDERSASVELVNGDGEVLQTITFIQDGQSKTFDSNGKDSYTIQAIGGEVNVVVTTNIEYNVNIPEAAQEWLSVADTRALVREETLTFIVAENETFEERSASVELVNGEGEVLQIIAFVQRGQTKVFESDGEGSYTIKAIGGEVSVAVTTNLEYSVVISEDAQEWLSVADTRAVVREETLTFIVAKNEAYDRRSTTVELVDTEGNVLKIIEFIQRAAVMPQFACPADEIWYTNDSTTEPTTPRYTDVFGANIISNTYSEDSERWVIKFDGDVTTIGDEAFRNCSSLTSVIIPDSVTTIGDGAFNSCSSLTSVTIPDSVTSMGTYVIRGLIMTNYCIFYNCNSLTTVHISDLSAWCKIDFSNYYSNPLHNGANLYLNNKLVTELVIPSDITEIKSYAFYGYSIPTSVTIGDNVTTIGEGAFCSCSSLTSVYITDLSAWCKIDFDGSSANPLNYAKNLYLNNKLVTELVIPNDITEIESYAFCGYSILTSVTIPDSVTEIGEGAFYNCSSLTSVTIPDSVTTIGNSAFYKCNSLTSVTIPDSVTTIGDYAFYWCSSLTSVTIPDSVTTIGKSAFSNCSSLTSVTIPDSVTTIEGSAFSSCSSLTNITIPDSVTTIGGGAFYNCYRITSVTIPDSVTTIGSSAFEYCSSLTSVTIGDSVTTIGECAFLGCYSLREFNGKYASEDGRCLIIDGTLNSFAIDCGVTEYTIPDGVTTIGRSAFEYCSSLTSVTIGDSVTQIGKYAFYKCSSLTSVYCKAITPPAAILDDHGYWDAFDYNASGRKIYVPMESVDAYRMAAGWGEYVLDIVGYDF